MKTYKFPSAYKRLATDSFRDTVDFQEKKYLIGEDAVVNGMAIWDIEKLKEVTPLFLKYLRDVRKEDISKVVLSVPSGVFANAIKRDKQGKKSYFNEVREIVLNGLKEIEDIRFLPQGVSAIYVYMNEDRMKIGDKVLTIDGGFNTLNLALTVVGKPLDIVKNKSMFDKGIRKLLVDYFYPILIDELQMDINEEDYHLLKKLFLSKKIMKGFKTINISNLVEEAVENYIRDLMEEVYKFLMKNYSFQRTIEGF